MYTCISSVYYCLEYACIDTCRSGVQEQLLSIHTDIQVMDTCSIDR